MHALKVDCNQLVSAVPSCVERQENLRLMYNATLDRSVTDSGCWRRRAVVVTSPRLNRPFTTVEILPTSSLTLLFRRRPDNDSSLLSEKKVRLFRPPASVSKILHLERYFCRQRLPKMPLRWCFVSDLV